MDFYGVADLLKDYARPRPEKPKQPKLIANPSKEDAIKYVNDMSEYETLKLAFESAQVEYVKRSREIGILIEQYMKHETGFYDIVPKQYQAKVWNLAYQNGHSLGWNEVYNCLIDLINIFE